MFNVAIPTFERSDWVLETFAQVRARLDYITIADDGSSDFGLNRLRRLVRPLADVGLSEYTVNVGCYQNKRRAVEDSPHGWLILFDSDNALLPESIDALEKLELNPRTLYVPTFASPHFDYRAYEGLEVDRTTIQPWVHKPRFLTALNTGNFLVERAWYLDAFDTSFDPKGADSLYFCYCWLKRGGSIKFVPGFTYYHRVHNGSNYMKLAAETQPILDQIAEALCSGL